ncbi:MAG TPA: hypothetical protein VGH32_11300, partial [Pirellulales bacterium]
MKRIDVPRRSQAIKSRRSALGPGAFLTPRCPTRLGFLATAVFASLFSSSAFAQAVSFTGNPSYAFPGFAPMIAGGGGAGTFTNTTSLVPTPGGFSISNGSFTYTSAAADVGKSLAINWIAFRPFDDPAGNYSNQTTLTGMVTVPAGGKITGFTVNTDWAGLGGTVPNVATASIGGPISGNASFFTRANGPTFFDKGGSDNLSEDGSIVFVPSAANQTFQVTFANAAPGGIDSAVNGAGWSYVNGVGGYQPGVGGYNTQIPDFYQHQGWVSKVPPSGSPPGTPPPADSANGWQPSGGWCMQVAYADVFYDFNKRGYTGVYANDPTAAPNPGNTNPWFNAMYGKSTSAADEKNSNIYQLVNNGVHNVQKYLDDNVNNKPNVGANLPPLISNLYPVNNKYLQDKYGGSFPAGTTGQVYYWVPKVAATPTTPEVPAHYESTGKGAFDFTNYMIKDLGADVLYNLANYKGGASTAANAAGQRLWWSGTNATLDATKDKPWPDGGNFHEVAVAGIDVAKSSVFVADPDSNGGSSTTFGGWPSNLPSDYFPGNPPRGAGPNAPPNGSFGLRTPSNAPLPAPANPQLTGSYPQYYAGFSVAANGTVTSTDAPQYTGTYLSNVAAVYPTTVKALGAKPMPAIRRASSGATPSGTVTDEETTVTLDLPSGAAPVDKIFFEPSSKSLDPATEPALFSLNVPSDANSQWTETEGAADPFGNALGNGGILYDLMSGADPLVSGEDAMLNLGTMADFSSEGYTMLFHFQGDPNDFWLPQMVGGTDFDPSDTFVDQATFV